MSPAEDNRLMELEMLKYLIPALIMFCCGVYGFVTRKNLIAILISLELMLNAVDINFVVFNRYNDSIDKILSAFWKISVLLFTFTAVQTTRKFFEFCQKVLTYDRSGKDFVDQRFEF